MTTPIDIFIATPVRVYREGLVWMLCDEHTVRLVGQADRAEGLVPALKAASPDILVLDSTLADSKRVPCALLASIPDLAIVVLGIPEHGQEVVAWAEAGVAGYVPQDASFDDFVATVRAAAAGELRCSAHVAGALIRRVSAAAQTGVVPADTMLTPREREIIELVDCGLSNKEIARRLSIKLPTVKSHVHNILEKLHAQRRGEAAALLRAPVVGAQMVHPKI